MSKQTTLRAKRESYPRRSKRVDEIAALVKQGYVARIQKENPAFNEASIPINIANRSLTLSNTIENFEFAFGKKFEQFNQLEFEAFYDATFKQNSSSPTYLNSILSLIPDYLSQVLTSFQYRTHPAILYIANMRGTDEYVPAPASKRRTVTQIKTSLKETVPESRKEAAKSIYASQMFFSQKEFESFLTDVFGVPERDCMYRAIYVLAWCGVDIASIPLIKRSDVDFSTCVIHATEENKLASDIIIPNTFCRDVLYYASKVTNVALPYETIVKKSSGEEYKVSGFRYQKLDPSRAGYLINQQHRCEQGSKTDEDASELTIVKNINRTFRKRQGLLPVTSNFKDRNIKLLNVAASGGFLRVAQSGQDENHLYTKYSPYFILSYKKWLSYYRAINNQ